MNDKNIRTRYLLMLYKLIDQNFYVLENSYSGKNKSSIKKLKDTWSKKDLEKLSLEISQEFLKTPINMIVPAMSGGQNEDALNEISVLHLYVLLSIVQDFLDALQDSDENEMYQRFMMRYPKTDVDFRGIASLIEIGKWNISDLLNFLDDVEILKELKTPIKKIETMMEEMIDNRSYSEMFNNMYELLEYLQSFLDSMEGQEFDWDVNDVSEANKIMSWVLFVETTIYYVLLIKETLVNEMNLDYHLDIDQKTEITDSRNDMIQEIAAIRGIEEFHK